MGHKDSIFGSIECAQKPPRAALYSGHIAVLCDGSVYCCAPVVGCMPWDCIVCNVLKPVFCRVQLCLVLLFFWSAACYGTNKNVQFHVHAPQKHLVLLTTVAHLCLCTVSMQSAVCRWTATGHRLRPVCGNRAHCLLHDQGMRLYVCVCVCVCVCVPVCVLKCLLSILHKYYY